MKLIKIALIGVLICLLFVVTISSLLLIFGLQSQPKVQSNSTLTHEDVARVKQFLQANDPRKLKPGELRHAVIAARDLNLLLSYAFMQSHRYQKAFGQVRFFDHRMQLDVTYRMPENPFGNYLNISVRMQTKSGQLEIQQLAIGGLTIPRWLIRAAFISADWLLRRDEQYRIVKELLGSIKSVAIEHEEIMIEYQWRPELFRRLRKKGEAFFLTTDEKERLKIYAEQLAIISKPLSGQSVSLTRLFLPLFQLAQQRTQNGSNAMDEHRALIFNLAALSIGRDMNTLMQARDGKRFPSPGKVKLTLLGRKDLAKHFLVSAAITVSGGTGLANLAGVFKELDDSRQGSGFSFADLAADRAGVRFGELASGSPQSASWLLMCMSQPIEESDFMPSIDHLPERIQELAFKRTYRDLDSESYRAMEAEIDRRIAACRIYQFWSKILK